MKISRRKLREELFKLLFETEIQGNSLQAAYEASDFYAELQEDENAKTFMEDYIKGLTEEAAFVQEKIEASLTDWDFVRIGYVEKALLRLAGYEIYFQDLGIEIIANEAVTLAKVYGDEKTYEFINGVLAKISKNKK